MKRLIRWALNHLPRTFLQRIAGISVPVLGWFYIGRGVECPVCGTRRRKFLPYGYVHSRPNALCPRCLSLERHRLLWLYLQRETDLPTAYPRILHIAPEVCLMRKLRKHYDGHPGLYLTADLESPLADMHFDVQHILQSHPGTCRRRPAGAARTPPHPETRRLGRRPVADGFFARRNLRRRHDHRSG